MGEERLSSNQYLILAFLCGLSYGILIALNAAQSSINGFIALFSEFPFSWAYIWPFQLLSIPRLESPMFWVMPFLGFCAMVLAIGWAKKNLKIALSWDLVYLAFLVSFVFLSLAAYYIALYWYIANFALLQGVPMGTELVDFWGRLHGSAYLLFFWGGVFGLVMRFAVEKLKI